MGKIEELKQQIRNLSPEELAELRDWFWEAHRLPPAGASDAAGADVNPGQLVEDVLAKIRKNV